MTLFSWLSGLSDFQIFTLAVVVIVLWFLAYKWLIGDFDLD